MKIEKLFDEVILETEHFRVEQDWEVPITGFFIVVTKRKVRSITDFSEQEAHEYVDVMRRVRKAQRDVLGIEDVYFFQNEDSPHPFHLWMLPRHEWMEDFGRNIESVRPIMRHAKAEMATDEQIGNVTEAARRVRAQLD